MKDFNAFLESIDTDKIEYDVLDLNFSSDDYEKMLALFSPEQFRYMYRLSKSIALAYLRQYDRFLREQSHE